MLMLLNNAELNEKVKNNEIDELVCVLSEDDQLTKAKLAQVSNKFQVDTIARARKVGQSYLSSIFTTLLSLAGALALVGKHKPRLCLTNGPAIGVTVCLAIRILQVITCGLLYRCDIIYIESFCRTKTLSLTGRIIYHMRLSTEFFVQWPKLATIYPRSRCLGLLV